MMWCEWVMDLVMVFMFVILVVWVLVLVVWCSYVMGGGVVVS